MSYSGLQGCMQGAGKTSIACPLLTTTIYYGWEKILERISHYPESTSASFSRISCSGNDGGLLEYSPKEYKT